VATIPPVAPLAAQAPAGYRTYKNKLSGLSFIYPFSYKEIPLPPTEQVLKARYVARELPRELVTRETRGRKGLEPQIYVFEFEKQAVVTTAGKKPAKQQPATRKAPKTMRAALEAASRVSSFEQFQNKRLRQWKLIPDPKHKNRYQMQLKRKVKNGPVGYLILARNDSHGLGVFGITHEPHLRRMQHDLLKMSRSLEFVSESRTESAEARLDRIYKYKTNLRAIEKRKEVRRRLAKGWKVIDTPNFVIVHHSKSDKLVHKIARDIEAMREVYAREFPPVKPIEAVSIVRVCRTQDEYRKYGGPPGTGGYWNAGNEELVFYDYSETMRSMDARERRNATRRLSDKDSLLVLYHEAFHQYIYYAVGNFKPHDWFNEGHGDYFSGAIIPQYGKKVKRIGPSPWRIHRAKDQAETGKGFIPLAKLLRAERAEFYNRAKIADYYAAAWSFVYFLRNSDEVAKNDKWAGLIHNYFDNLRVAYAAEIALMGGAPNLAQKQLASFKARKTAIEQTLHGIDLAKLEAAWRKFVIDMRDPWPSLRKEIEKRRRRRH